MKAAKLGLSHRGQVWPKPSDLASAIGNAGVDVVSSPATIGYLEFAALYAVEHLFEEGEASVGVARVRLGEMPDTAGEAAPL